jgi:hypothetical protein
MTGTVSLLPRILSGFHVFILLSCFFLSQLFSIACAGDNQPFQEVRGEHFLVEFTAEQERASARQILDRAELYYSKITSDIGHSRHQQSWAWDRRVRIVLYPDQFSYNRFTGQPQWSKAYASRYSKFFSSRVIVSWLGQLGFLEEALPHEIAHLVLWDFLGFSSKVPLWLEEGIAQLAESDKREIVQQAIKQVEASGQIIPLAILAGMDIVNEKDTAKVSLFYAQSLSLVLFMLEKHGRDAFRRLLRELRDGKDFEQALQTAYPLVFPSVNDLEKRWKAFLSLDNI